ncbi:DoxX family protein [Xanthobacter sp. V4C-4]|uniref:DoxX family protein n=1 Tax=Xanthobacter cornucopiae TaxID=3119924 RepID=UPI003729C523
MTPLPLSALLESPAFAVFARIVLTFIFWSAGIGMAVDYGDTLHTMARFGLDPAAAWAPAVIATLLVGSLLVIVNRLAWLGYGILATFTALCIPIAHAFWTMAGEARIAHFHVAVEHISLIGGLMAGAIVNHRLARHG